MTYYALIGCEDIAFKGTYPNPSKILKSIYACYSNYFVTILLNI